MRKGQSQSSQPNDRLSLFVDGLSIAQRRLSQRWTLPGISRVLGEGLGPWRRLAHHTRNLREMRRLLDGGCDITFISSFFRSGNTWTRCLLADILLQNHGVETTTSDSNRAGAIVPDIYSDLVSKREVTRPQSLLVKTHETFDVARHGVTAGRRLPVEIGGRLKALYLYRSPEDVLISFYHFRLLESPKMARWIEPDAFCRAEFSYWLKHLSSYLSATNEGVDVLFMSYERLLKDTVSALGHILSWLETEHTQTQVERAVHNMQFGKLRAMEETRRQGATRFFYRNGREGSGVAELSADTCRWIRDESAEVMAQVERRATPSPRHGAPAPLRSPEFKV